jgi:hypothetical protein
MANASGQNGQQRRTVDIKSDSPAFTLNYDKGVRFITGGQRWDFALAAFKKFVAWRAGNDEASAGSYAASHSFLTTLWRLSSAIRGGRQQ